MIGETAAAEQLVAADTLSSEELVISSESLMATWHESKAFGTCTS